MLRWYTVILSVSALAFAQTPARAFGSSLTQICNAYERPGGSRQLGFESSWRDGINVQGNSGHVVVQKKSSAKRASGYADVVYDAGSGPTRLLRLSGADIHSWEGRVGLIERKGQPVILGTVTEAGMRYVGVALWSLVGPGAQPHRIGVVAGYRRALRRADMGGGTVGASEHAPIFSNPRLECMEGEAWLIEEWFVLGQLGVACWKFDEGGNVAPVVVYRNSVNARSEVEGARTATVTRIFQSAGGPKSMNIRIAEPPDIAKGFPTCNELLESSGKEAGARK